MRKQNCPACNALKNGIKSRRAFEHMGCEFDSASTLTKVEQVDNNIIVMKQVHKTDAQLVDELAAENRKLRRLINNANSLLRSAYSIAERSGEQTNWEAFKNKVGQELNYQSEL